TGDVLPSLAVELDPGTPLTNRTTVRVNGATDPGQLVLFDRDGDGFDDGSVTAGPDGLFFLDALLSEGPNTLHFLPSNSVGSRTPERSITLDSVRPTGTLVSPPPGSVTNLDQAFIDIRWSDLGSGLDAASFDPADVTIPGVDVDRAERVGDAVRYT